MEPFCRPSSLDSGRPNCKASSKIGFSGGFKPIIENAFSAAPQLTTVGVSYLIQRNRVAISKNKALLALPSKLYPVPVKEGILQSRSRRDHEYRSILILIM